MCSKVAGARPQLGRACALVAPLAGYATGQRMCYFLAGSHVFIHHDDVLCVF